MVSFTAYNKIPIPSFMYGTAWKKDETSRLVQLAVSAGFKAIDTANQLIHYNEAGVGEALLALAKKGIKREGLFLQTKFTPVSGQDHRTPYDASADITSQVSQSFESSLKHLHTTYVDSYVLHGPYYRGGLGPEDWEVWAALEGIYRSGRARMIGVSNVSAGQLAELCEKAAVKPMVVQNRCFAVTAWDKEVREICKANEIIYQGFSLLTANQQFLGDSRIRDMAGRLGTGPLQVIFRFAQQIGILPLTGTSREEHMKDDLEVRNMELTPEEVSLVETIGK